MTISTTKTHTTLTKLIRKYAPDEGFNQTVIDELLLVQETSLSVGDCSQTDIGLLLIVQGNREFVMKNQRFEMSAGQSMLLVLPTIFHSVTTVATPEKPFHAVAIRLDLTRVAEILVNLEAVNQSYMIPTEGKLPDFVTDDYDERLLNAVLRLVQTLEHPAEVAILAPPIIDEVYFHMLMGKQQIAVHELLKRQGHIHLIAHAVKYIQQELPNVTSVDQLADIASMSVSSFRKRFQQVMGVPPIQYVKQIRLERGRILIRKGYAISEAARQVGYNSPSQFSREYRRHFGHAPSETQ